MLEQLSQLAEIVGVIAIIASLIYVAKQLKQNTELLRSASRQALLTNDQSAIHLSIQNVDLLERVSEPDSLSFQDQWRFSALWLMDMRNREHEYFQFKAGVLDEETWNSYRQTLHVNYGFERGRKWWESVGRFTFDPGFVQMVDEVIAEVPDRNFIRDFGSWD